MSDADISKELERLDLLSAGNKAQKKKKRGRRRRRALCAAFAAVAVAGAGGGYALTHGLIGKQSAVPPAASPSSPASSTPPPPVNIPLTNQDSFYFGQSDVIIDIGQGQSLTELHFVPGANNTISLADNGHNTINGLNAGKIPAGLQPDIDNYQPGAQPLEPGDTFLARNVFNYCTQGKVDGIKPVAGKGMRLSFHFGTAPCSTSPGSDGEPELIQAFGSTAVRTSPYYYGDTGWQDMVRRQQLFEGQTAASQQYKDFVSQFDALRGEPLLKMATSVNDGVTQEIKYDNSLHLDSYIASPGETVAAKAGNCSAFATLQYYILRHLGVPADRLFIALVSAVDSTRETDHAVLLVNVAPDGAKPDFVVLNDGGAVVNAADYQNQSTLPQGWDKPYVFYQAVNEQGAWLTPLVLKDYFGSGDLTYVPAGDPVPVAKAALAAKPFASAAFPRPKSQIAYVNPPVFRPYGSI